MPPQRIRKGSSGSLPHPVIVHRHGVGVGWWEGGAGGRRVRMGEGGVRRGGDGVQPVRN